MDPILTVIRLGDGERIIGNYGVMLGLAIIVAATITMRAAARARIDAGAAVAAVGFTAAGAFAGAFALFLTVEWLRTGSPVDALRHGGGLVFYGAPLGGGIALYFACRGLELPFFRLVDEAVVAIPAAHAIGRLGCFLGGCCFGRPLDAPWAVLATHPIAPAAALSIARHPVALYESALLLLLALLFTLRAPARVGQGQRLWAYLAAYGLVRFAVEFYRGDSVRGLYFGNLVSTSQLIALATTTFALVAYSRGRRILGAQRPPVP